MVSLRWSRSGLCVDVYIMFTISHVLRTCHTGIEVPRGVGRCMKLGDTYGGIIIQWMYITLVLRTDRSMHTCMNFMSCVYRCPAGFMRYRYFLSAMHLLATAFANKDRLRVRCFRSSVGEGKNTQQ